MNTYRIHYVKGQRGVRVVRADTVNGFRPEQDTYVFKTGDEVVAVIPKARVLSIQRVGNGDDDTED